MKDLSAKWPRARLKLVEKKANGAAIIDELGATLGGIVAVEPDGSKVARAHACTPTLEAGNVWLPEYASWVQDYVEEMVTFPNGANDDRVDETSQMLRRWQTHTFVWDGAV